MYSTYRVSLWIYRSDIIIMLSSCNMLRMIRFKYNVIIPVIFSHSDLSVHSKQYRNHIENVISSLFICCCLSGYWSIKLEYHSMMVRAEKSFDGCNSIVYFVITIKGTGEEPKHLRWMAFSFSNLMLFFFPVSPCLSRQEVWRNLLPTSILQHTA